MIAVFMLSDLYIDMHMVLPEPQYPVLSCPHWTKMETPYTRKLC